MKNKKKWKIKKNEKKGNEKEWMKKRLNVKFDQ